MTDHQKILQTVLQSLNETSRLAFLKETIASLPQKQRIDLLQHLQQHGQQDPAPIAPQIFAQPESTPVKKNHAEQIKTSAPEAIADWQALLEKAKEPKQESKSALLNDPQLATLDPTKSKKVMSALNQFEQLQQVEAMGQKKTFRKEAISCVGLALLAISAIVLASLGLKYLWTLLFP